jgi:hypothetical protein
MRNINSTHSIIKVIYLLFILPLIGWSQVGPITIIDNALNTAGVTKFVSADLDNDGDEELVVSFTGNTGRLGYYTNQSQGVFAEITLIEDFPLCRGVAVGDFNNDGWKDIVAIGGTNMDCKVFLNNQGSFTTGSYVDADINIQLNDVVVNDFDSNGFDDIVVIGQHSIDYYRNNGMGGFTKEAILTTSTSPEVLECLDLSTADIDNDGDMDLVCSETAGLVVYTNNGNGIFTPHYYSLVAEIGVLVHLMDVDNDGDLDVVMKNSFNQIKWFSNNGSGVMTYEAVLGITSNLIALDSIDYNNDGLPDIYASYLFNVVVFLNNATHTFSTAVPVVQNNSLLMGQVLIANMDGVGNNDFVWAGGTNTIAYNANQTPLALPEQPQTEVISFFPNPTSGKVSTTATTPLAEVTLYTATGKQLMVLKNATEIDLSSFAKGLYFIKVSDADGVVYATQKIVKY